ncbi:serine hydrolase domain-containing protein [Antrihabitans stalactiti]|uniref:Beta-lactamase family protein n=1 Tax=Antrihabitans stalactiti TaxID=2584121 RepID=A0A848KNG4_9NOCA|nr:serine hydrolase domain-containing protein [Antrihabitans stalactiti]NMN99488.1 beta-lactamase family protein [Antrihabitans stalactiti]
MKNSPHINGDADEGFGRVVDEFRRNFTSRGDIGAALAVYQGDRPVIDLWAGVRDKNTGALWERDTTVNIFSSTKGIAALVLATAVSAGILDYDEPVATYWPEFASHGKGAITVRQLIDHQAGLHSLHGKALSLADLADLDLVADVIADQKPAWQPGTRQGYHTVTLGLYENELFRRVDPGGRTIGRYVAEEIATPLGVDLAIGLSPERDIDDIAQLSVSTPLGVLKHERHVPFRLLAGFGAKRGTFYATMKNPPIGDPWDARRHELLDIELASGNGVGNARALARVYGAAAADTGELAIKRAVLDQLAAVGNVPAPDAVLGIPTRYHLGLRKSTPTFQFGSRDNRAYGTPGLGGSIGFADPSTGIGFGYTMNRLGLAIVAEQRCEKLRGAVFDALGA